MWLKSLYCFHFIVFSDNNFGKSFQDALSGKQSYRGSWYKYANNTIPRWPTSAVFWNSLTADRQHQGRHTRSSLRFWSWTLPYSMRLNKFLTSLVLRVLVYTRGIITWLPWRLSMIKKKMTLGTLNVFTATDGEHLSMLIITFSILSVELILITQSTVSWHNRKMASNSISMVLNCFSSEITMVYETQQRN